MKKILFFAFFASLFIFANNNNVNAQETDVLNGIYVKEHVPNRIPVPFQYVREADVMWSKTIWRIIDLKEKINHPLYFPTFEPLDDRMSLIDLFLYGIKHEGLVVFNPDDPNNEFPSEMTYAEIESKLGGGMDTIIIIDPDTGLEREVVEPIEVKSWEVKEYIVKEVWFFDKQRSVLEVRIIGMCPIRHYYKEGQSAEDGDPATKVKLFWVYYPAARRILANHEVFNPHNDAERRTFDDMLVKRFFSSYIIQESNTFNNRMINEYTVGIDSMIEAEKIKNAIFNFEQNLWEY